MTTINISRRALKDEFHKKRQAILIITTDMVMENIITSIKDHMTDNPDDDYISTVHKLGRERTDTDDYHGHVLARKRRAGRCKEVLSPFISPAVPGMLQILPQENILFQLYRPQLLGPVERTKTNTSLELTT